MKKSWKQRKNFNFFPQIVFNWSIVIFGRLIRFFQVSSYLLYLGRRVVAEPIPIQLSRIHASSHCCKILWLSFQSQLVPSTSRQNNSFELFVSFLFQNNNLTNDYSSSTINSSIRIKQIKQYLSNVFNLLFKQQKSCLVSGPCIRDVNVTFLHNFFFFSFFF